MEHQPSTESLFELQVDFESGNYFKEATRWSKFIAVFCFVIIGLFAFVLLLVSQDFVAAFTTAANQNSGGELTGNMSEGVVLSVIVIALVIFTAISVFLFRFANMVRQGIERQDQSLFNKGVKSLKLFFMVMGVFSILSVIFTVYKTITELL